MRCLKKKVLLLTSSLKHKFNKIKLIEASAKYYEAPVISDEILELRAKYSKSLALFLRDAWPWIEGGKEYIPGWHIDVTAEHLEATFTGQIRNLLIGFPPRCCKSTLISVAFSAWLWTKDPSLQLLYASYAQSLSRRDSRKCRRLITSPWFQRIWGSEFQLLDDSNTVVCFDNNKMGYRIASSVGGTITGEGGDYIIIDDANNINEVESAVVRDSVNDWFDQVMSTRFNNPKTGRLIAIQQRGHIFDLTGHLLSKEDPNTVHLRLPMEFEPDNRCVTVPLPSTKGKPWFDPRTKDHELLWPARIGPKELETLKRNLGSEYRIAGQLQMRPSPAGGSVFKKEYFKLWEERSSPPCEMIFQSLDTALSISASACYSVCTTWGLFKDKGGSSNLILLGMWQQKVEYPDLRDMAQRLARNYLDTKLEDPGAAGNGRPSDFVLIEYASTGGPLIADLRKSNIPVLRFDPKRFKGKLERARVAASLAEGGRIWLPTKAPTFTHLRDYANKFLEACVMYNPYDKSNDVVDSFSQAVLYIYRMNELAHPGDPVYQEEYEIKKDLRDY